MCAEGLCESPECGIALTP
jgi:hypothetical protein